MRERKTQIYWKFVTKIHKMKGKISKQNATYKRHGLANVFSFKYYFNMQICNGKICK